VKVALYIGDHAQDGLLTRLGWAATRLAQKGPYDQVTHVEAIHLELSDGTVDIASASLRDEARVRTKKGVQLDPGHWWIVDMPAWSTTGSREWFREHDGAPYDKRGAVATVLPGHPKGGYFFCNHAVGASAGQKAAAYYTPAQFAGICFTFGRDVTLDFFMARAPIGRAALA
jgi:hypothetical protein